MSRRGVEAGVVGFLSLVLLAAACASEAPDPMVEMASAVYATVVPTAPPDERGCAADGTHAA